MPPRIHRRHVGYALRPGTWRHVGRRARWRAASRERSKLPPSWDVDGTRARIRIRWPLRINPKWPNLDVAADFIKTGISSHIPIDHAEIPQPVGNVFLFHVVTGRRTLSVVVDTDDRMLLNDSSEVADLYFKLQYRRGGYGSSHIHPGGYLCPNAALYRYRWRWRDLRDRTAPSHDVYGRFATRHDAEGVRARAVSLLQAQDRFCYRGGVAPVWWGEYMDEMCRARVCVDLPGRGELCYRLIEYLAVGACVIGPELDAELPMPLEPGTHLLRVPRSLDRLVDECELLLRDEPRRKELSRAAEDYFDRYLSPEQLGAYYLATLARALDR